MATANLPGLLPKVVPEEQTETKQQPPYAVVLHNDDINGFDYVIGVLRKVFKYGLMKAFRLPLKPTSTAGPSSGLAVWR
jgi:ATP-dependent Clp protease adapter protein ClpS